MGVEGTAILYDPNGNVLLKAEDSAHASGDYGIPGLIAVRKDVAASLVGADGDYTFLQVDANGRLHVIPDTELPAAAALADDAVNPTTPTVGAAVLVWDGAAWDRLRGDATDGALVNLGGNNDVVTELAAAAALADAAANPTTPMVGAAGLLYNGATWDRERGLEARTLLSSAARTTGVNSSNQTNYSARGVVVILDITVASGTGGLRVTIKSIDSISGNDSQLNANATLVTTVGRHAYVLYPGATSAGGVDVVQATDLPLTRSWRIATVVGNSSSYTYSVTGILIP